MISAACARPMRPLIGGSWALSPGVPEPIAEKKTATAPPEGEAAVRLRQERDHDDGDHDRRRVEVGLRPAAAAIPADLDVRRALRHAELDGHIRLLQSMPPMSTLPDGWRPEATTWPAVATIGRTSTRTERTANGEQGSWARY